MHARTVTSAENSESADPPADVDDPWPADGAPRVERTTVVALGPGVDHAWVRGAHALLSRLDVAGLAPLVRISSVPDGLSLTHRVPVDAITVAELAATRPLRPGHVLAVARSVTTSLAGLHEAGLAHGSVGPVSVLVGLDGSIVLTSSGAAHARSTDPPRTADDVAAVGELVRDLLGSGSAPGSLVVAALRASDGDPLLRPTASALLAALERCGASTPLLELLWDEVPPTDPVDRREPGWSEAAVERPTRAERVAVPRPTVPPRPSRRSRRRHPAVGPARLRLFGAVLLAVTGLPVAVALSRADAGADRIARAPVVSVVVRTEPPSTESPSTESRSAAPTTHPAPSPAVTTLVSLPTSPAEVTLSSTPAAAPDSTGAASIAEQARIDWIATLADIDAGRTGSIAVGSVTSLRGWVDPAGPAWAADARTAAEVSGAGARLEGGGLVIESLEVVVVSAQRVELRVTDRRSAYAVVVADGRHEGAPRESRQWVVTLTGSEALGWRIFAVEPATVSRAGPR